jgi:hypothetical protein
MMRLKLTPEYLSAARFSRFLEPQLAAERTASISKLPQSPASGHIGKLMGNKKP